MAAGGRELCARPVCSRTERRARENRVYTAGKSRAASAASCARTTSAGSVSAVGKSGSRSSEDATRTCEARGNDGAKAREGSTREQLTATIIATGSEGVQAQLWILTYLRASSSLKEAVMAPAAICPRVA